MLLIFFSPSLICWMVSTTRMYKIIPNCPNSTLLHTYKGVKQYFKEKNYYSLIISGWKVSYVCWKKIHIVMQEDHKSTLNSVLKKPIRESCWKLVYLYSSCQFNPTVPVCIINIRILIVACSGGIAS